MHAINPPSTGEGEAGGSLSLESACLPRKFQDNQGYAETPCLKKKKKKPKGEKNANIF